MHDDNSHPCSCPCSCPSCPTAPCCSHQDGTESKELSFSPNDGLLPLLEAALGSPDLIHEHVLAQLSPITNQSLLGVVVAAAGFGQTLVRLSLSVQAMRSMLTSVELTRTSGSATLSTSVALALWQALELAHVTRLRVADSGAVAALADARTLAQFRALRVLNLSQAGLAALPTCVGMLTELQVGALQPLDRSEAGRWWQGRPCCCAHACAHA